MEITEIKVNLVQDPDQKLLGFCSLTFDQEFVVRDLRIIRNERQVFVAKPSRKTTAACSQCHGRNVVNSAYCNHCGSADPGGEDPKQTQPFTDLAHPITRRFREKLEQTVLNEYHRLKGELGIHDPASRTSGSRQR